MSMANIGLLIRNVLIALCGVVHWKGLISGN
jgi:hypothetical protein